MRWLVLLVLLACHTPQPVPPAPDADAAPAPVPVDAGGTCTAACAAMASLHCAGLGADCATTMQKLQDDRLIRAPNGQPVTCACVASATSAAAVEACGIGCVP